MKVIKPDLIPKEPTTDRGWIGGQVTRQTLVDQSMGKDLNIFIVHFSKGARNQFHKHSSDQLIIVTAGKGIVATEKEEKVVGPSDVVFIPAGEKHWHGATDDSEFSHIYILTADSKLTLLED